MAGFRFQSRLTVFFNADGTAPAAGGTLTFCVTGTDDLATIYLDGDLNDEAANPVQLDADGRMPYDIYMDDGVVYRVIEKDSDGVVIQDEDPTSFASLTDAIHQHDISPAAHYDATTTNRGFVFELANDAEAQAMTDTARVLTPSNLAALTPTTTRAGLVERATTAEIEAGTDDVRYISPLGAQDLQATSAEIAAGTDTKHLLGVKNFADNMVKTTSTLNGKIPGLVMKIGTAAFGDVTALNHYVDITFPEAFSTACLGVWPIFLGDGTDASVLAMGAYAIVSKSASACRLYVDEVGDHTQTGTLIWLAFGY